MKLHYWKNLPSIKNFGDQLSPFIWDKELEGCFNNNENELFLGIGTLLDNTVPVAEKYYVMGSGAGYHQKAKIDNRWKFYAVRGPLTADLYGLPEDVAITDPAVLTVKWHKPLKQETHNAKYFMPHWSTSGLSWKTICEKCGLELLDPKENVSTILNKIADAKLVVSESLHGAIIADTFRVPWIPVKSRFSDFSEFKWTDWQKSMNVVCPIYSITHPFGKIKDNDSIFKKVVKTLLSGIISDILAMQLRRIEKHGIKMLSDQKTLEQKIERYEEKIKLLKRDLH